MNFVLHSYLFLVSALVLTVVRGKVDIKTDGENRVEAGATVKIICSVSRQDYTGPSGVRWIRKTGTIYDNLGAYSIRADFDTDSRYSITQSGGSTDGKFAVQLTIRDAQYEDTSQIGCVLAGENDKDKISFVSLAVCEDSTSTACECMERLGWSSPSCFEKPVSVSKLEAKYDRTVTGLAVCLGIAVIFGFLMAILVGWDCMTKVAAKKKKQMEMQKAKMAAKRAGYTDYQDAEKLDLDPNDSISNPDYEGFKSGAQSPAPVNAYASMTPNVHPPHTHVNRAYVIDDHADKYEYGAAAAASPASKYGGYGAHGRVPEVAAEIEVHASEEDYRSRMELGRSTPEGSVGSAKNNEPPNSQSSSQPASRYDVRSPRYNDYNSSKAPGYNNLPAQNKYKLGFEKITNGNPRSQADSSRDYNDMNLEPGTWATQSPGIPPTVPQPDDDYYPHNSRNAYSEKPPREFHGRTGYTEPRELDFHYGKSDVPAYNDTYNEPSGAYVDKTDTVV